MGFQVLIPIDQVNFPFIPFHTTILTADHVLIIPIPYSDLIHMRPEFIPIMNFRFDVFLLIYP
jgi:hypothetical protein